MSISIGNPVLLVGAAIFAALLLAWALWGQGPRIVREYRTRLRGYSDLLLYAGVVDDGIVLNKDGSFIAAWEYRGNDLDSADESELTALSQRVNDVLRRRGSGWMLHVDAIRTPSRHYVASESFPDRTTQLIEDERREQHEREDAHFESRFFLTITYLPVADAEDRFGNLFIEGDKPVGGSSSQRALAIFKAGLNDVEDGLSHSLRLRRLKGRTEYDTSGSKVIYDDLLAYLNFCVSAVEHPIRLPRVPFYLDAVLGNVDFYGGLKPRIGKKHLRLISISGFPNESVPGILEILNRLPMALRWSNRFICLDSIEARKRIDGHRKKWFVGRKSMRGYISEHMGQGVAQVDNESMRMANDAQAAMDELASGQVSFGYYTSVIVIADEDAESADNLARLVLKVINGKGFSARIEEINAVEAFLGTHPGNGYANVRKPLIHTRSLADFLPLLSLWPGEERNPSPFFYMESSPLMYAATSGATPFRLNLHVSDLGHTLVLGPSGSGKSTLLGMIAAQFFRYRNAQVFLFDKGYSSLPLVRASGGEHYDILGEDGGPAFCPLGRIDTMNERIWAADWLESLLLLQGVVPTPGQRQAISHALYLLSESPSRTLTDLLNGPLQDATLCNALDRYTLDGGLGALLDSKRDGLGEDPFQVFELEHLMQSGEGAARNVVPILLYLFHRIEQRLDGSPTLLILDEAWTFLDNPLFAAKIRDWLKTLRKKNAAVVFATQSVSDILEKPVTATILESCPTKIFLANAEARSQNISEAYRKIGLSDRQIEILSMAIPKKHYYYTSILGQRLFDLDLGPAALAFVGAAGREDLQKIRALIKEFGDDWPAEWLCRRGKFELAARWVGGPQGADAALRILREYRDTWPKEWMRSQGKDEEADAWTLAYLDRNNTSAKVEIK